MTVQIIYERNINKRYEEYRRIVDTLPESKVIMGIFNKPMRPVNRLYQYEAASSKKRKAQFESALCLNPDVIIVDGVNEKDLDYFLVERGHTVFVNVLSQ